MGETVFAARQTGAPSGAPPPGVEGGPAVEAAAPDAARPAQTGTEPRPPAAPEPDATGHVVSRSEGYHVALAVALALAQLAVDPATEHAFVVAFLARWGEAIERRKGRPRKAAR